MNGAMKWVLSTALLAGGAGCHSYEDERPPVDSLDKRDKGLQSKDVVDSSDQMAASILGDADLNARPDRMLIVVGNIENKTANSGARMDLDIFLSRVSVILQRQGRGRITLLVKKAEIQAMQSKELDLQPGDEFGQGGNKGAPLPARRQPDYMLNGTITELNNRGTSYYLFDAKIFGLKGQDAGVQVWADKYEVKVDK